jgi:hypothetical protein
VCFVSEAGCWLPATAAAAAAAAAVAAAAATTTAAAAAVAAAAAAAARLTRTCLVNGDRTATDLGAVELLDGRSAFAVVGHFNESEAAGTSSLAIHDDVYTRDGPVGLEELLKLCLGGLKREISDVNVLQN